LFDAVLVKQLKELVDRADSDPKVHAVVFTGTASKSKHELVKRLGATPIDYKGEDFVERIRS